MKAFKFSLFLSLTLYALSSTLTLALQYYENNTLNKHKESVEQLKAQAKNGDNSAAFLLATAYKNGKLGPANLQKAFEYYKLSAVHEDPDAMLMLGWLYYKGTPFLQVDEKKATYWFKKAAQKGVVEAAEMLELLQNG